jgi:hypothetical protein
LKNSTLIEKNFKQFLERLNFGIDIPFFFNGDPKKFSWKSSDLDEHLIKDNQLQDQFEYIGSHFSAYDKTYDLTFEVQIDSELRHKISKFPLISYTWTDEGYKNIYQGTNVIPIFNFEKDFTVKIRLTIT